MGFFSGRAAFLRFKVIGDAPRAFGEHQLAMLKAHNAEDRRTISADGIDVGWTAGDHILDHSFGADKNIVSDMLVFGLRVDSNKLPSALMRAYYANELKALTKGNKGDGPSAKQKKEAKEIAKEVLEDEAKTGKFIKRKAIPVHWDGLTNEVLFGSPTLAHVDRVSQLFQETFGLQLELVTAGPRAYHLSEVRGQTRMVDDSAPSAFIPGVPADVDWITDESGDFLGNEFLLWLWYRTEVMSDTIIAGHEGDEEISVAIADSMTLECSRGETGQATLMSDKPSRMGEARYAIRTGKLPRKAGLRLVRLGVQYELTLAAETLAVSAAELPPASEESLDARGLLADRIRRIRDLIETLDLLYDAFGRVRFGEWEAELKGMQQWLRGIKEK